MALTSIGSQKTPGRPIELFFEPETGLPDATQDLLLIGHKDAVSGNATVYEVVDINNVVSVDAASGEVATKFGDGSELAKMVLAAIRANENAGRSSFPSIKCIPLAAADTNFGAADAALTAAKKEHADFVVSPYDGMNATLRTSLRDACVAMSGATRTDNGQYGTTGVAANINTVDPSNLDQVNSANLSLALLRDSSARSDSLGEIAAGYAAVLAGNPIPFNPVNEFVIGGLVAPAKRSDYLTIGSGLESETTLQKGWTPLRVKANGDVSVVRSVTTRLFQADGVTAVTAYYDVQDYQVLYYWRKTLKTRFSQPDFTNAKNSKERQQAAKAEVIRLAKIFEDQGMFQFVDKLAPQIKVETNASDRHRMDILTPVNVIPGLHVMAARISAGTQFDTVTV